jgi:hypothetical protein
LTLPYSSLTFLKQFTAVELMEGLSPLENPKSGTEFSHGMSSSGGKDMLKGILNSRERVGFSRTVFHGVRAWILGFAPLDVEGAP